MTDQRIESFLKRIPPGAPARISVEISTAFGIVDNVRDKVSTIRSDAKLTRDGQNAAIAAALAKGPLAHMKQLRTAIETNLAGIQAEREAMRRAVVDAAAFPEARKTEVRTWLRSLPDAERFRIAHETTDPLIVEAIATAPHYLSSVKSDQWEAFVWRHVEANNKSRLAELVPLESAYLEADAAIKVATADLKRESGLAEK